jgi:uncharacterized protein (TIGR03435 family)
MNTGILSKSNAGWKLLMGLTGLLALVGLVPAQNAEAERESAGLLRFEVASIKAVAEGAMIQCGDLPCLNLPPRVVDPQRFRAMTTLDGPIGLIEWAYGVRNFQVVGAPEWLGQQKFDVQATAGNPSSEDQIRRMVQTLLEDRFRLRVHRETRQVPVYALVVGKKGPSLTPAKDALVYGGRGDIEVRPGRLFGRGTTMAMLAMILTDNLERPVIDRTGLTGHYDFNVTYEPSPAGPGFNPIGAAIFVPIQDLGLKLESQKDAVEVLVIDGIERPSAN